MKKNERQGNIEILRILCMILIIIHHYCVHGGIIYYNKSIFINFFMVNLGKIASNTFILITGIFLFKSKFKIQKIIRIILEAIFYSFLVTIIFMLKGNKVDIISVFFPIYFKVNWFITAYLGMYLILPFIKPTLNKLSKNQYLQLLIVLGCFIVLIPTFVIFSFDENENPFGEVITFIYLSMIGGFISKFDVKIFKYKIYDILSILSIFCIGENLNLLFCENSLFVIILSVLIIDLFLKLDIKNNKLISFFSDSCLGVLLLHDNSVFNNIMWVRIFNTREYYFATILKVISHMISCTIIIFLIGSIIDYFRRKIENYILSKFLDNNIILNKINETFNIEGRRFCLKIEDVEIKYLLKEELTEKIYDREVYMKGIDASYRYEGYNVYKAED